MQVLTRLISIMICFGVGSSVALAQDTAGSGNEPISAKQLVVMIDGRFPTTDKLTEGAGIVVGRKGGLVYIATAGHVVQGLTETAVDIKVQFQDRPGEEIDATLWPSNLDKGIDLAILVVPEDRAPVSITSLNEFSAARISQEVKTGEGAYLFGQPSGRVWSGNKSPEKVVSSTSTSIEVESKSVVPGLSGGATFDEGLRIVGLIIETDNGLARIIPLKFLKEKMEEAGYPFDLVDAENALANVDFDPIRELTARGYQLSKNTGFLGASGGANSEFKRALTIDRLQDAQLFVQAGIKLDASKIFGGVDVPTKLTRSLLEEGLLNFDSNSQTDIFDANKNQRNNSVNEWCSRIARFELSEEIFNERILAYVEANNIELIEIACADNLLEINGSFNRAAAGLNKLSDYLETDAANLENYKRACIEFIHDDAPIEEIAKHIYALAYSQTTKRPDFWALGEATLNKLRKKLGSKNLLFYDDDMFAFRGWNGNDDRNRRFQNIYDRLNYDFYAYYSGVRLVNYMIDYRTKADVSMTDALRELLSNRANKVCEKGIKVRPLTTAEKVQLQTAQVFLQALN